MGRYLGPKLRLSRREGEYLEHKSTHRSIESKCKKFKSKPGEPAKNMRSRPSDYSNHLRAKQKMRLYYGVLERQFRNYYRKAAKAKGDTGSNLIAMLESRLDNVLYRMGIARTRAEARQMVSHKLVEIDGGTVNVPSYQVRAGQSVALKEKARGHERVADAVTLFDRGPKDYPPWLDVDAASFSAKVTGVPDKASLGIFFDEGMVVEYYSK